MVEPAAPGTSLLTVILTVHNWEAAGAELGSRPRVPGAAYRDAGPCAGGLP